MHFAVRCVSVPVAAGADPAAAWIAGRNGRHDGDGERERVPRPATRSEDGTRLDSIIAVFSGWEGIFRIHQPSSANQAHCDEALRRRDERCAGELGALAGGFRPPSLAVLGPRRWQASSTHPRRARPALRESEIR